MAKKAIEPIKRYSAGDQCLMALLLEPVKGPKIKKLGMKKIKQSEELLRCIVHNELMCNVPISSPSTT